jgi:UDP-N-acetylmuramoylalanine--D-glutamate ligase
LAYLLLNFDELIVIEVNSRNDQTIAILGLGLSGMASAKALRASGAGVVVWDDNPELVARAKKDGFVASKPTEAELEKADALLVSPGISFSVMPHPAVTAARAIGKPIIGDIELLAENIGDTRLIAVTGTNGKSTTTSLIHHILNASNICCQIGGNIGNPVLNLAPPAPNQTLVLELSSFQLDLIDKTAFDISVLINISPDHLDRHGSMDDYISAKKRIFLNNQRSAAGIAIVGIDDAESGEIFEELSQRRNWKRIPISIKKRPSNGVFVHNHILTDGQSGENREICDLTQSGNLLGTHNHQNIACAYAACIPCGVTKIQFLDGLNSFPGLPHRLEKIGHFKNFEIINDSKATNVAAAITALSTFNNILWIAGGRNKGEVYRPFLDHISKVRHAFLIGEAASDIATALEGAVPTTISKTLENATWQAISAARETNNVTTILFSPGCASFDQFSNFSHRGEVFKEIVGNLARKSEE